MNEIRLLHLEKSYQGKPVLRNFTAALRCGEMTALMAPSGAGKTTLLRILMGLDQPDSGRIEGLDDLRISAVFQENRLCMALNPVANIRLVNPSRSREEVAAALRNVGLGDSLSKRTSELSGGMCRRVAILRALMAQYDLLLLDEPFQGLDQNTKRMVMEDTCRRCRGQTVLFVTHDPTELEFMGVETCLTL